MPSSSAVAEKPINTVLQDWIQIAEYDNRPGELRLGDELQRTGQGHTLAQRLEGGALDSGPIGERVAERDADLDDVGHFGGGAECGRACTWRRVASREVGNESLTSGGR